MTDKNLNQPSIYVACFASYNSGITYGTWIYATQSLHAIQDAIQIMLDNSPAKASIEPMTKQWAIHDCDNFKGVKISENESLARVYELANFIYKHDRIGALILNRCNGDIEQATSIFKETYCGEFGSLADYVEEVADEVISTTSDNQNQYEEIGRDMERRERIYTYSITVMGDTSLHIFFNPAKTN